jgi:hypothetical protein
MALARSDEPRPIDIGSKLSHGIVAVGRIGPAAHSQHQPEFDRQANWRLVTHGGSGPTLSGIV